MPERTAQFWEEKAAKAVESANRMRTTELRLAFLKLAENYKQLAERARTLERWRHRG
jgi:hypothetical protein